MSVETAATRDVIERRIMAVLTSEFGHDAGSTVGPDESLLTGEYLDSVGIMRLIAHLEATFHVRIPPTDLIPDNFRTVRVMAAYLAGHVGRGVSAPPSRT
jgi:acyl carrier protein